MRGGRRGGLWSEWAGTLLSRIPEMNQECPRRAEPAASGRKVASVAEGTPPRARGTGRVAAVCGGACTWCPRTKAQPGLRRLGEGLRTTLLLRTVPVLEYLPAPAAEWGFPGAPVEATGTLLFQRRLPCLLLVEGVLVGVFPVLARQCSPPTGSSPAQGPPEFPSLYHPGLKNPRNTAKPRPGRGGRAGRP